MNRFSMLYRDITCGVAATLITLMLGVTFVQSTSLPPGARGGTDWFVQMQPQHAWFGQPQPAVLVD